MKAIIVWNPHPCGKTSNKKELQNKLGCMGVIEDWAPGDEIIDGALHLSHAPLNNLPPGVQQLTFKEAMSGTRYYRAEVIDSLRVDCTGGK